MGPDSFQWCPATGQGATGTNWSRGSSGWTWGRTSSLWGWRSPGTGCPGRLWSLLLWRYWRPAWTMSCAACCRWPCFNRGDVDWVTHRGPFQPETFCDSAWLSFEPRGEPSASLPLQLVAFCSSEKLWRSLPVESLCFTLTSTAHLSTLCSTLWASSTLDAVRGD